MSLVRLRLSMFWTLALIIGLSTLFFTVVLSLVGVFDVFSLLLYVVMFNAIQLLIAPYLIDMLYRVKEVSRSKMPKLYQIVEDLSRKSGIRTPRIMIAEIPIPNAFAYGSPIAGTRVAVTTGLMKTLEPEEVEAVVGHELGHIKHRDVQIMMFVSVLPAICYFIGFALSSSTRYRERGRSSGVAVIGAISMLLYFVLTLFILRLSRLREYYADRHSATIVEDGARKLSEGLAKIVTSTGRIRFSQRLGNFKTLFITDPDNAVKDTASIRQFNLIPDQQLVQRLLAKQPSSFNSLIEILSTHPNIIKRLRTLQKLRYSNV